MVTASGRVAEAGIINVALRSGLKRAVGSGRLSGTTGSGTWHGDLCSGYLDRTTDLAFGGARLTFIAWDRVMRAAVIVTGQVSGSRNHAGSRISVGLPQSSASWRGERKTLTVIARSSCD